MDTLSKQELGDFLKYHFVQKDLIFTDGKMPSGEYPTARVDESSTLYNTINSKLNIRTLPDKIQILDKDGNVYLEINEQTGETNQLITFDTNEGSSSPWDFITTGIIHSIDKVLIKDSLQVN